MGAMKLILTWFGVMLFLVIIGGGLRMTVGEFLLMAGGTLIFFVILGQVVDWPEKVIRWVLARLRRKPITKPPPPPPRQHNGFDDVI